MIHWLFSWQGLMDLLWLLVLLSLFVYVWRERKLLMSARLWVPVSGRIQALEWLEEGPEIWQKIQYTYVFQGQEYQGEHLYLETPLNNPKSQYARNLAYQAALAYKNDEAITVYCNPDNPIQSALDIRVPPKLHAIMALLLFFLGLHFWVLVHRWHWF